MGRFSSWLKSKFKKKKKIVKAIQPIFFNGDKLSVEIESAEGFTEKEFIKFKSAVELLLLVVNSQEFRRRIFNSEFLYTNGLSSLEIYNLFMSGKDQYSGADNDLDIKITIYYANNRTVGYTYPNTNRTWINRKFFQYYSIDKIVNNLVHEYCHNIGFTHPSSGYSQFNVPYAIGNIAGELARHVLNGNQLTSIS